MEILVVHDSDEDTTLPVVRALLPRMPQVRLHRNDLGRGVLNAMRAGIDAARAPYIVVSMADGSDDVEVIDQMVAARSGWRGRRRRQPLHARRSTGRGTASSRAC